ncbi:MAG: flagellar biosynthetic protein FliR, partial [Alphaproteobacteria bacterium]
DFAHTMTFMVAQSFVLAAEIAAPFLVIGMVFYLGLGLLGRLMPQVQVFFIAMPVQIGIGLMILALTSIAAFGWFLDQFREHFGNLFFVG